MYVNRNMTPVGTIPGMGGVEIKNGRGGEFKYDIFDIRTFVNATMYPHPAQQFKKREATSTDGPPPLPLIASLITSSTDTSRPANWCDYWPLVISYTFIPLLALFSLPRDFPGPLSESMVYHIRAWSN
jgi:hypothetical protein